MSHTPRTHTHTHEHLNTHTLHTNKVKKEERKSYLEILEAFNHLADRTAKDHDPEVNTTRHGFLKHNIK